MVMFDKDYGWSCLIYIDFGTLIVGSNGVFYWETNSNNAKKTHFFFHKLNIYNNLPKKTYIII